MWTGAPQDCTKILKLHCALQSSKLGIRGPEAEAEETERSEEAGTQPEPSPVPMEDRTAHSSNDAGEDEYRSDDSSASAPDLR